MAFAFENTPIDGVILIHSHTHFDDRGLYKKVYEKNVFQEAGIRVEFTETSDLIPKKAHCGVCTIRRTIPRLN